MKRPIKFIPPLGPPKTGPRQRALAAWRGVDVAPLEVARGLPARRAGDFLPAISAKLRLDQRRGEAEIVRVWDAVLDPTLTAQARPVGLHKGTLFVNVSNSVWLSEIVRYRRREILERLQHSFGKELIQRISFRPG
jgi:hypothetical protein